MNTTEHYDTSIYKTLCELTEQQKNDNHHYIYRTALQYLYSDQRAPL
jgi:hypothetical protein